MWKKTTKRELVDSAIEQTAALYAIVSKIGNRAPTAKEVLELHAQAGMVADLSDALLESQDAMTAEEEWDLLTKAAIPTSTLIAVNLELLKDAKAEAAKIEDLAMQALALGGVTAKGKEELGFTIARAKLMQSFAGAGPLSPKDWGATVGCPGRNYWIKCADIKEIVVLILIVALAKKFRVF